MKKIYIVTSGEYSDFHIDGAFSTNEKAERYIKIYASGNFEEIEEFDVDEDMALINKVIKEEFFVYQIDMLRNGNTEGIEKKEPSLFLIKKASDRKYRMWEGKKITMWVLAKDERHAIKIVNEKRTRLILTKEWIEK